MRIRRSNYRNAASLLGLKTIVEHLRHSAKYRVFAREGLRWLRVYKSCI